MQLHCGLLTSSTMMANAVSICSVCDPRRICAHGLHRTSNIALHTTYHTLPMLISGCQV